MIFRFYHKNTEKHTTFLVYISKKVYFCSRMVANRTTIGNR